MSSSPKILPCMVWIQDMHGSVSLRPGMDVYSSNYLPFVSANQYIMAEKLVIVTLDMLHTMAELTGEPKVPVTIMNNMGRCGSTMACKALSQIPGLRVMSEPWPLYCAHNMYQKGCVGLQTYSLLIASLMKIQCKIVSSAAPDHIMIKLPFPCMAQMTIIKA